METIKNIIMIQFMVFNSFNEVRALTRRTTC